MSHRGVALGLIGILLLQPQRAARAEADPAPRPLRPNVILVLTDDQRADTLSEMPQVLEQVAARGVRFANAFVTTPVCAPSRASIYSGRYARHHGIATNTLDAAVEFDPASSFVPRLRAAGYRTGLVGLYLAGSDKLGAKIPEGWDEYFGLVSFDISTGTPMPAFVFNDGGTLSSFPGTEFDEVSDRLRDRALEFLRANAGRPFFLLLAALAPHAPAVPARRHAGKHAATPPWRPPSWREPEVGDKPRWVGAMKALATKQKDPEAAIQRNDEFRLRQLDSLLVVDDAVGAISKELEALGLTERTALIFTSDNGHHWGEHWSISKFTAYEESVRVPLVVRYPPLAGSARTADDVALNIDLGPTILDLAGLPPLPGADGRSLVPILRGESLGPRSFLIESPGDLITSPADAVRTERWKLIRTRSPRPFLELYDLRRDPYELTNLATDPAHAKERDALSQQLDRFLAEP